MVHRGTLVDVSPTYCGGRSGCYVRILQAAAMTGAFTATTGWLDNGTSSACPSGNTCVTYPSLTAPATHVPATTTEVEADPDVAKCWIYHTIIHFDPQPGDPADPGDPVTTPGACSASVPSCYGMTVAACESAVAAAGGTVSFNVNTGSSADPNVADGLVIGTSPRTRPLVSGTAVTITTNPANSNPQACEIRVDNPHESTGTPGAVDASLD
jgi:hypothetical protein